jgi:hypothetical protein
LSRSRSRSRRLPLSASAVPLLSSSCCRGLSTTPERSPALSERRPRRPLRYFLTFANAASPPSLFKHLFTESCCFSSRSSHSPLVHPMSFATEPADRAVSCRRPIHPQSLPLGGQAPTGVSNHHFLTTIRNPVAPACVQVSPCRRINTGHAGPP